MTGQPAAMHVARIRSSHTDKQGRRREYESRYLRRTYRDGGKVRHETLANLSGLPDRVVDAVDAALRGDALAPAAGQQATITRSLPHGHVAAVHAMARKLRLPALLGPAGRQRDLALALIISRVAHPGSKLSTLAWWGDVTLGPDLGIAGATIDEAYAAMDWLQSRQDAIEARLARRHLAPEANPQRMALFGLSSSWLEGSHCPPGARGYSRDGKKGNVQIEYGLLTDPAGRPVAVRVLEGSTADPAAFTQIAGVVHDTFRLKKMVMVGDRGMITTARIEALKDLGGKYAWITALRAPAIRKLMAGDGPLQLSLFDEQDFAEITSEDFPGERLIACRNPALAEERARKREDLLAAEARLDGIYVIRTPVPATDLDAGGAVTAYKNLKHVERDFRQIKSDDLDLRPVFHRLENRVRGHVLICMLAAYLSWHLRQAWAPLTYTDEEPPDPANPVAPARRPASAEAKASRQHDANGRPYRSFEGLLGHLATLTRNELRLAGTPTPVPVLAEPTTEQRQAFELIDTAIPLTLRK